jgi:predicted nucleic acid-binding protein
MAAFVLDCSVAANWFFNDETSVAAQAALATLRTKPAIVPGLFFVELANVLTVGERRGRLKRAEADSALRFMNALRLETDTRPPSQSLHRIIELARSQALSAYDATYLDLAMHAGLPLATLDEPLRKAARKCGVALFAEAPED